MKDAQPVTQVNYDLLTTSSRVVLFLLDEAFFHIRDTTHYDLPISKVQKYDP